MNRDEVLFALETGKKVKLPEWTGYWFIQDSEIKVMTKEGDIIGSPYIGLLDARDDWIVTNGLRNFGGALYALKAGKKVTREGWNGSDMYAILMPGYPEGIAVNEITRVAHGLEEGAKLIYRPYFQLFTAQGDIAMWAPSGSDVLAEDWYVIN